MVQVKTSWGVLLPTREVVMAQGDPDLHKIIDLAAEAEALGFDSVWVGDSILARPRLEALTTLAAIASRTRRVRLGTAVLLSALRHPVLLANEVANLDILSSGRVTLGLGIATKHPTVAREFAACGIPLGQRIGMFEEGVEIMRRLWTEPRMSYTGRHFRLDDVTPGLRPIQRAGIPLWLAGSVDNALRRVIRLGDGWFPNPSSPQAFVALWTRLQTLAAEMGRDVAALSRCVYTTLNINADVAQAEREMRGFMEGYYGARYDALAPRQGFCAGTAESCVAWLQAFVASGAQTVVIRFGGPDQFVQLERCAKEVLPHLHG
jgi:alkanesulfonate monooxygenase SsuD/methylene tetrahydromethanopterin reductase-like flavin-dependent oxidoreductase (luciferase family)